MHRHVMTLHVESMLSGAELTSCIFRRRPLLPHSKHTSMCFSKLDPEKQGKKNFREEPAAQPSHLFNYILFQKEGTEGTRR